MNEVRKWASIVFAVVALCYLAIIWSGSPDRELVWFMVLFGGLFRQIAGTWSKPTGRFAHIALPTMAFWFFLGWNWWLLAVPVTYFLVKTLPVTFIGNSVRPWYNRLWTFALGFLNGLAAIPIGIATGHVHCVLGMSVVTMLIYGVIINLANFDATGKYFPWKLDEAMLGSASLLPAAMCIDHFLM